MGGMLPAVGTGREASPSPRGAGRHRVQGAGREGRKASWELPSTPFPADHTPAPQESRPGKAGSIPSVPIPTVPCGCSPGSQAPPRLRAE